MYIQGILIPLACFVVPVALGLFVEIFILKKFQAAARRTRRRGGDILVRSLKGMVVFWMIVLGGYLSLQHFPFRESLKYIFDKTAFSAIVLSISILAGRLI